MQLTNKLLSNLREDCRHFEAILDDQKAGSPPRSRSLLQVNLDFLEDFKWSAHDAWREVRSNPKQYPSETKLRVNHVQITCQMNYGRIKQSLRSKQRFRSASL